MTIDSLEKGKTSTMNVKKTRILATEIFKTINNLFTINLSTLELWDLLSIPKFYQTILSLKDIMQPNMDLKVLQL